MPLAVICTWVLTHMTPAALPRRMKVNRALMAPVQCPIPKARMNASRK